LENILYSIRESIEQYCAKIGLDSKLVQGAGGNVSWKDKDTLWIKASGEWLADANKKDIFLPIDLKHLEYSINISDFNVTPKTLSKTELRPSIETLFHAVMPHKVVLHLHPIVPLSYLVRKDCFLIIKKKLNPSFQWDLIDYKNLSRDPDAEHRLISKQKELKLDLERLVDEEKRLHSDREFVYKKG